MILTIGAFVAKLIRWAWGQPEVKDEIELIGAEAFHDIFFRSNSDPDFRQQYGALSTQMKQAVTREERLAILNKMRALRTGSQSLAS